MTTILDTNISNLPTYAWFKKIVRRAILGFETLNHPNPLQKGVLLKCPHSGCNTIIADGTQIGATINATFSSRANGVMIFTVSGTSQSTLANAGNWTGEIAFTNSGGLTVDQQQFNIDIKQSF